MTPAEKTAYEMHQKALRREASLDESTYVLGKGEGKEEERIKQEINSSLSISYTIFLPHLTFWKLKMN